MGRELAASPLLASRDGPGRVLFSQLLSLRLNSIAPPPLLNQVGLEAGLTARVIDRVRKRERGQGIPVMASRCKPQAIPTGHAPFARLHPETGSLLLSTGQTLPSASPREVHRQLCLLWTPSGHAYQPTEVRRTIWQLLLLANRARKEGLRPLSTTPFELWEEIASGCVAEYHRPVLSEEPSLGALTQ